MFSDNFKQLSNSIQVVIFTEVYPNYAVAVDRGETCTGLKLPMGSSPSVPAPGIASWCLQRSCRVLSGGRCLLLSVPGQDVPVHQNPHHAGLPWPRDQPQLAGLHSLDLVGLASLPLSNAPFFLVGPLGDEK